MHWRTVDLQQVPRVSARRGALLVNEQEVPLADVTSILLGEKTGVTAQVLHEAARFGVPILLCDWRSVPVSVTLPWSENTRVAARHLAQASCSLPRRKASWAALVKAKIRGQAANLRQADPLGAQRLLEMVRSVRSGDPGNVEAQAAALYWRRLNLAPGFRRRAGARTGPNGALDYAYTILRGALIRSVVEAGLCPTLGLWHHSRSNRFCLADDLIEPFRPAADHLVLTLPYESLDPPAARRHLGSVLGLPMESAAGSTLGTAVTWLGRSLADTFENGTDLNPPVWTDPSEPGDG